MAGQICMIVRNVEELKKAAVEHCHEGEGTIFGGQVFGAKDFGTNWQFIDWWVIPKGASIRIHKHVGEEELYFIVADKGIMVVDDEEIVVKGGDMILTKSDSSHGFRSEFDKDVKLFVVLVKK